MTTATELPPLEKVPTPRWMLDWFDDIDSKRFGDGFDCFLPDAEMNFGVAHWHGRDEIIKNLKGFDHGMDTVHVIDEVLRAGDILIMRGHVRMTFHDTGRTATPIMTHLFHLAPGQPDKIRATFGSVGPLEF